MIAPEEMVSDTKRIKRIIATAETLAKQDDLGQLETSTVLAEYAVILIAAYINKYFLLNYRHYAARHDVKFAHFVDNIFKKHHDNLNFNVERMKELAQQFNNEHHKELDNILRSTDNRANIENIRTVMKWRNMLAHGEQLEGNTSITPKEVKKWFDSVQATLADIYRVYNV